MMKIPSAVVVLILVLAAGASSAQADPLVCAGHPMVTGDDYVCVDA